MTPVVLLYDMPVPALTEARAKASVYCVIVFVMTPVVLL